MKKLLSALQQLTLCILFLWATGPTAALASHYVDDNVNARAHLVKFAESHPNGTLAFISHGRPAQLFVHGKWMSSPQLAALFAKELQKDPTITQINLYGCAFGQGSQGREAVAFLEKTLGIPVAASDDLTGHDGDWELEVGHAGPSFQPRESYPFNLQYSDSDDFDGDGIINSLDLDDDNDGVLDSQESLASAPVCTLNYPTGATSSVGSSATLFAAGRELANTYDNNLGTFGGTSLGTGEIAGTITYTYSIPLNHVTEFQFFSNGGSVLNDGQVTRIGSLRFYDSGNNLLQQFDNVMIPQASITTPYVLTFTSPLDDVASFTLTDLADISSRTGSKEAIWKEVNLKTCTIPVQDIDTDNDGISNRFDLDSDGDGCPDSQEAAVTFSFPQVQFADIAVTNPPGSSPSVFSQISRLTFQDTNSNGFDDRLEPAARGSYAGTYLYEKATDPSDAVCIRSLDSDDDGIADQIDLDDDNDGILDTVESGLASCMLHYPDAASSSVLSSPTIFPPARSLENTYDNNLDTYGGTFTGTASLNGTITYTYNTPLNNVTEFQFFSNGGSLLSDGQVTNIGSIQFYDQNNNLLYQQSNLVIPQASTVTPYVLSLPMPLQGVASFRLTDLSDQTHGSSSEAVWKEVNLKTCSEAIDLDSDQDGIVNRLDLDSDGDGCPDSQEASVVTGFSVVTFANIPVVNSSGPSPAKDSQVESATFQDLNQNGFDDRFETQQAGNYTGIYTYLRALDPAAADCKPLPVTLIAFKGQSSTEANLLFWETTQEKGFDRFQIEASRNLRQGFHSVGELKGGKGKYHFTDYAAGKGNTYYRLKMIDLDGSTAYSRIVQIYRPYGEEEHTVYPNPSSTHSIHIHDYFAIEAVQIYDLKGNAVKVTIIQADGKYEFKLDPGAAAGIYMLQYRVGETLIRRKFSLK